jgi:hypothetical protein
MAQIPLNLSLEIRVVEPLLKVAPHGFSPESIKPTIEMGIPTL